MNHRVTIAIPTYNRKHYLKLAIDSCLRQTYKNIEILIVDNCSTDGTDKLIESINDDRIVYYRQKKPVPPVDNWNKCIELAESDYFTFLPDDDLIADDYVELMLRAIVENEGASIVRCGFKVIDSKGDELVSRLDLPEIVCTADYILRNIQGKILLPLGGVMSATRLIKASGGFEETGLPLALAVDHLLWLKLAISGSVIVTVQECLFFFRKHPVYLGSNLDLNEFVDKVNGYVEKYKKVLEGKDISSNVLNYIDNKFAACVIKNKLNNTVLRILNGNNAYSRTTLLNALKFYLRPKFLDIRVVLVCMVLLIDRNLCNNILKTLRSCKLIRYSWESA